MQLGQADTASYGINGYFEDLIAGKRRRPKEDLLSELATAPLDPLSTQELSSMSTLLFAAGFETTTNLVGNGMVGLLEHRERSAIVTADGEMITYAISRERFAALLDKNPKLAEAMFRYMRERYAD